MNVKNILIQGFKSIVEPVNIDFTSLTGLTKIVGPVGSGKTTIGEAILYGLYGQIKGKNLPDMINMRSRELYVEINLESKGHDLTIKRGMKLSKSGKASNTVFDAICDGEPIVFSNKKEAQSILENEYYDTSRMSIELLCIISFNNFKSLLTMTPKDRTDFLNQTFGLALLQEYSDKFKVRAKEETAKQQDCINKANMAKTGIEALETVEQDFSLDIDKARDEYRSLQIQRESIEAARKTETEPLNERIKELEDKCQANQRDLIECETLGKQIAKQMQVFASGCCPTCNQKAPVGLISDLKEKREELVKKYSTIKAIISGLTQEKGTCSSELNQLYDAYSEKLSQIKSTQDEILGSVNAYKRQEASRKAQEENKEKYSKALQLNESLSTEIGVTIDKCKRIYDILSNDIKKSIISAFIPTINKSINSYSRRFGLPFRVEFDDLFEPIIISSKFSSVVPLSTLSTGQSKAIDTCIILGVIDALLSKINFNITFFDELMSNMDTEMRDSICKVLKETIKGKRSIFIINHAELNDEYFSNSILVENSNGSKYIFK